MEEYIDRIIIAAKKEIEGKKQVDVSLVETLISTIQTLHHTQVINKLDDVSTMNRNTLFTINES